MNVFNSPRGRVAILAVVASGAIGFGVARWTAPDAPPATTAERGRILYWYDPMVPNERHDGPGLSSMGMTLRPKYASEGNNTGLGVTVDPSAMQNLGMRVVAARLGTLTSALNVTGVVDFNQRDVAIVQSRAGGFVERVYARAPGDVVGAGSPIADILVPEWGGAQTEYLAVRRVGDRALTAASRQRLRLLGMSEGQVSRVERGGRVRAITTITAPIGGVIQSLDVRRGMTLAAGQTLAQISGLSTVWLNAAVPEALAGRLQSRQSATAEFATFPGEKFFGRVIAVLPTAQADSRTLTLRIELRNDSGRLRPGMFATVHLNEATQGGLLVPSEAVIRTGKRTLVMLAQKGGRYRSAEVRIGQEADGQTVILAGLAEGEKVVASGQFLIDSEASLSDVPARPIGGDAR